MTLVLGDHSVARHAAAVPWGTLPGSPTLASLWVSWLRDRCLGAGWQEFLTPFSQGVHHLHATFFLCSLGKPLWWFPVGQGDEWPVVISFRVNCKIHSEKKMLVGTSQFTKYERLEHFSSLSLSLSALHQFYLDLALQGPGRWKMIGHLTTDGWFWITRAYKVSTYLY
jgi:hypothetical protein